MRKLGAVLIFLPALALHAAELKDQTLRAFGDYVRATEAQIDQRRAQGRLLWFDGRPEFDRDAVRKGQILIERRNVCANGNAIEIPDGMVSHWIGIEFIPGAKLDDVLQIAQDVKNHKDYYRQEVLDSKLLSRQGDRILSRIRVVKKKVITVVLDITSDAVFTRVSPDKAYSRSRSLSVQEVENAGKSNEKVLAPNQGHGYLWRLYSYFTYEQRDGGVYVETEALSLTRDVPMGLGALIRPFTEAIPREGLCNTLTSTRSAVLKQSEPAKPDCALVDTKKSEACQ